MSPDTFKKWVGILLAAIVVLALSPWDWGSSHAASFSPPAPQDHTHPGYYPPAPSTAVGMTPEWRRFADSVDRICAVSFNYAVAVEYRNHQVAHAQGWSESRAESAEVRLWGQEDARILRATAELGPPPERPALFARWRANVRLRSALFFRASRLAARGDFATEGRTVKRIFRLKGRSDKIGQRFGLRICTSN